MSWKIISKLKQIREAESGAVTSKRGGSIRICLVYPNCYRAAMSNLGFQAIYAFLNAEPDILCERSFLPDPADLKEYEQSHTPLLSLESRQPVAGFDIVAFSVSFESDYLHLPTLLRLAAIPCYASDRNGHHPLVMAGGAAIFLNPEPVADFLDVGCLGEGEIILPPLLDALRMHLDKPRPELLASLGTLPGIYLPGTTMERGKSADRVSRQFLKNLDEFNTATKIRSPHAEFGDMHLLEISRGCPRGCRFCAAGFIYLPYRQRSPQMLIQELEPVLAEQRKVGLVAAAVGDYQGLGAVCKFILERGGSVSVSSLRIDGLDDDMIEVLVASGHKTATLAPEGGSQRLRDLVRKGITEEQILAACERLIARDILNLKLYFIIGLPTETEEDITEMLGLISRIRNLVVERARVNGRLGEVVISVNPFIPKPFTPFQWCGMMPLKLLEKRLDLLQKGVRKIANVTLQAESLKEAMLQALLSRGDRGLARFLVKSDELGSWKKGAREVLLDIEKLATRCIPLDEPLPWGFIDSPGGDLLTREYKRAFPDTEGGG